MRLKTHQGAFNIVHAENEEFNSGSLTEENLSLLLHCLVVSEMYLFSHHYSLL